MDPRELAERIRRGDTYAFESVYLEHFVRLVKLAYSYVRAPDIAEEIVQEVFLNIWEKREGLAIRSSIGVYLYTAVRNRSLNAINHSAVVERSNPSTAEPQANIAGIPNPSTPIDENTSAGDLEERIGREIQNLTQGQREVLILHWKHGLSLTEIGEVLGVSSDGARMQLRRAQSALWALVEGLIRE